MFVWYDTRFVDKNFTDAEALKCFPGMIRPEQVDEIWKPDIFLEGTMDGVNTSEKGWEANLSNESKLHFRVDTWGIG